MCVSYTPYINIYIYLYLSILIIYVYIYIYLSIHISVCDFTWCMLLIDVFFATLKEKKKKKKKKKKQRSAFRAGPPCGHGTNALPAELQAALHFGWGWRAQGCPSIGHGLGLS